MRPGGSTPKAGSPRITLGLTGARGTPNSSPFHDIPTWAPALRFGPTGRWGVWQTVWGVGIFTRYRLSEDFHQRDYRQAEMPDPEDAFMTIAKEEFHILHSVLNGPL